MLSWDEDVTPQPPLRAAVANAARSVAARPADAERSYAECDFRRGVHPGRGELNAVRESGGLGAGWAR